MKQREKTKKELTPRELELLLNIAQGYADDETASRMKLSKLTIRQNVHDMLEKTLTVNRPQLVYWACQKGLI